MPKNSSFTRQDIRFLTKQIAQSWLNSTPEEKAEFQAITARAFKSSLKLAEGYSGPSAPKRPAKDGTITLSTENMASLGIVAIGLTMSQDESSRAIAKLIQNLLSAGSEFFPGQITLDRKVFLKIMVDWTALVSKLAVASRVESKGN